MSGFYRWYILIAWFLFVFVIISFPMPEYEGEVVTLYDKVVHLFLFGIFAYLLVYNIYPNKDILKISSKLILASCFIISVFYAGLAEYWQNFIPGRTVSEYDFFAGVIGVILFEIIAYVSLLRKT